MNKEEFLKKLRKKIDILEESEVEDIIDEYAGFIDEKMSQGVSEEEAVKSMGNINELARELLSAYKVKNPNSKSNDVLNNFIDEFLAIVEKIVGVFANKSFKDIIRFVIELICIFIIIAICKIPFEILREMGRDVLVNLSNTLGGTSVYHVIASIGNFFLEICYLIFAVVLFIKIFESRYLNSEDSFDNDTTDTITNESKDNSSLHENIEKVKKRVKNGNTHEYHGLGIIDGLTNVCVAFIKVIAFCILVGVICYIVGMTAAVGLSIYLLVRGVFYFGFYLVIFALLILGIVAFIVLFNFIFNRKGNLVVVLITSLVCFVLLGVGAACCAVEVANTTIIYDDVVTENQKIDSYEYEMKDNLVLEGYYDEFVVDESLGNKIKIEYSYNADFMNLTITPSTYTSGNYEILHYYYNIHHLTYDSKIFDSIIEDLKDKKIRTYSYDVKIKVYASSEVKEQLNKNQQVYERTYENDIDYELEDICEDLYEEGYELPNYCLPYYSNYEV